MEEDWAFFEGGGGDGGSGLNLEGSGGCVEEWLSNGNQVHHGGVGMESNSVAIVPGGNELFDDESRHHQATAEDGILDEFNGDVFNNNQSSTLLIQDVGGGVGQDTTAILWQHENLETESDTTDLKWLRNSKRPRIEVDSNQQNVFRKKLKQLVEFESGNEKQDTKCGNYFSLVSSPGVKGAGTSTTGETTCGEAALTFGNRTTDQLHLTTTCSDDQDVGVKEQSSNSCNEKVLKRKDTEEGGKPKRKTPKKWDPTEETRFLEALHSFGRDWKKCAKHVGTRDANNFRSHAQKFFIRLYKQGSPLPKKVAESGAGYTLSGRPLDPNSSTARCYLSGKVFAPGQREPSQGEHEEYEALKLRRKSKHRSANADVKLDKESGNRNGAKDATSNSKKRFSRAKRDQKPKLNPNVTGDPAATQAAVPSPETLNTLNASVAKDRHGERALDRCGKVRSIQCKSCAGLLMELHCFSVKGHGATGLLVGTVSDGVARVLDIISLPLTCEMLEKSLSEESSSFPGGSEIQKVVGSFRNRGLDVIGWYSAGGSRSDADLQPKSKSNAKRINLQTHDSVWKRFSSRGFHRSVEEHGDALDSAYGAFVYAECDSSCGPGDRIQWYNGRDAVAIPRNNVRRIFGSNMDSFILEPNEMSEFAQRSVNQLNEAGLILSMSPSRQSSGSEGKIQRNSEKTSIKSMSELEQLRNALLYWLSDPVSEEECAGSEVSQVVPYKKISSIELQVAKATGAAIIDFVVNLLKQNFIKLESRLMTK